MSGVIQRGDMARLNAYQREKVGNVQEFSYSTEFSRFPIVYSAAARLR